MQTPQESQPESRHVTTVPEGGAPFAIQVGSLSGEKDIVSEPLPFSEGKLLAVVVRGDAKANLKITLEWGETLPTGITEIEGEQS